METATVHPRLRCGDVAELNEDAADHLVGATLAAQDFELRHHPVERQFDAGDGAAGVTVTLSVQLTMTALEFLAIELREQGHSGRDVHGVSGCRNDSEPL